MVSRVPARHAPSGRHNDSFGLLVKVPVAHVSHTRSLVVVPVWWTRVPGMHVDHSLHAGALFEALKVPLMHAVHLRSDVGVTSSKMRSPGRHCVARAQAVLGSLS